MCYVLQLTLPEDADKTSSHVMVEDVFQTTRNVTECRTAQTEQMKPTVVKN